ncbi:MAG: hypothetical protein CML06_14810 [Pseudomonadales bacterium]|nr:hypothetical protein [Pseudomonadales bacterium]
MKQWLLWTLAVLLGFTVQAPAVTAAEESPEHWLQTMLAASRQTSFSGYSVHLSGGQLNSMAVYHAPIDGEVWERVVHMSGEPAEIIRKGRQVYCLHPRQSRGMAVSPPLGRWGALEESAKAVSRYYRFQRMGEERVAGRDSIRLNVEPLDEHRYGYSLWLDRESGVLLRAQTAAVGGMPLEVFEFVSIQMGAALDKASFEPSAGLQRRRPTRGDQPPPTRSPAQHWGPQWLPEGFVESDQVVQFSGQGDVTSRAYTDGLTSFTVFHEPESGVGSNTVSAHGATVAVHRQLADARITVVGEIPVATAERIAASVKPLD